jgi:hypothetical protein
VSTDRLLGATLHGGAQRTPSELVALVERAGFTGVGVRADGKGPKITCKQRRDQAFVLRCDGDVAPVMTRSAARRGDALTLGHERDDVAHDAGEVEVLGRVDRRNAGLL